ncbi:hypothetical protein MA16_Dca023724 [Dendrobium catenatum]|uniref:RVP_2 domain-containing protein n=1 Tax=Dendrobium catenatum TaxID=906689 RepID=A0A2I0X0Q2_9ASPA|nr:hypothetical protein MA16_Dca023724 [Dendrobium catenatum]
MARDCPRGPREGRSSAPLPQQNTGRHPTVGRPRAQESTDFASVPSHPVARPVVQPSIYVITQQKAKESPDVITGIIYVQCLPNRVLFDTGTSHSFISQEFIKKHALDVCTMPTTLLVLLPDGSSMIATNMCSTFLTICEREFNVVLIVLPLLEFDVILRMDLMSNQFISIDCSKKVVKIKFFGGEKLVFQGDRGVSSMIISSMKAYSLILKGYPRFLAYVRDTSKQVPDLKEIAMVRDFPDVFPELLPGMPHVREIDFSIDFVPSAEPISKAPYRMAVKEL